MYAMNWIVFFFNCRSWKYVEIYGYLILLFDVLIFYVPFFKTHCAIRLPLFCSQIIDFLSCDGVEE